jgi:uncharacterized protein (DUF2236 family)
MLVSYRSPKPFLVRPTLASASSLRTVFDRVHAVALRTVAALLPATVRELSRARAGPSRGTTTA